MSSARDEAELLAGKYALEHVIGTGGMGTVYRATHVVLNRPVAVKLMNLRGSDPTLAQRFLREARVAAAVRHPNVVDIIDFGTTDSGQPFMVMELLEGITLWDRMAQSPQLDPKTTVELVAQVLLGLDAVHRAGIVHRDLKPANVFLSPHEGGVFARLLDFGISYSVDPGSTLRRGQFGTDEQVIIGTPEYMSPEQAEGRRDVDERGDVYAMGVILYEMLTNGRLPYADENPGGVLFKVMSGGHTPLSQLHPELGEIAAVVDRALAHDREARPASARELRRQLLAAAGLAADVSGMHTRTLPGRNHATERPTVPLAEATPEAAPAVPVPDVVGEGRRRLAVLGVAIAVIVAAASAWRWSNGDEAPRPPIAGTPVATTSPLPAPAPTPTLPTAVVIENEEPGVTPSPEVAPPPVPDAVGVAPRTTRTRARAADPEVEPTTTTTPSGIVRELDF